MNAFVFVGSTARDSSANGARMPSTALDVCADIRNDALRAAADCFFRYGLDCLRVMSAIVPPDRTAWMTDAKPIAAQARLRAAFCGNTSTQTAMNASSAALAA